MIAGRVTKVLEEGIAVLERTITDFGGSAFSRALAGLVSDAICGGSWTADIIAGLRQRVADIREAEAA